MFYTNEFYAFRKCELTDLALLKSELTASAPSSHSANARSVSSHSRIRGMRAHCIPTKVNRKYCSRNSNSGGRYGTGKVTETEKKSKSKKRGQRGGRQQ